MKPIWKFVFICDLQKSTQKLKIYCKTLKTKRQNAKNSMEIKITNHDANQKTGSEMLFYVTPALLQKHVYNIFTISLARYNQKTQNI